MSRDEDDSPDEGVWGRLRAALSRTRDRLLGGGTRDDPTGDGSGDEHADAADGPIADGGPNGNAPPLENVLTPEERVVEVVSANGGGMKQGEIVSALDWSESTVSRRLSDLESDDVVSRYQIGREKHVYLPGAEPEPLESPLAGHDADQPSRA